jgi:prophage antirepressor-like protein
MRTELMKFDFDNQTIRTKVDETEQVWFAGIDICNILGYADSYQAIMKLDEDERKLDRIRDGQGRQKETLTVNEFGLYSLILTSTKSEAKSFKRWVTHEVLPAIRKAGLYTTEEAQNKEIEVQQIATFIEEKEREITDTKSILKTLTSEKDDLYSRLKDVIRRNPNQLKMDI